MLEYIKTEVNRAYTENGALSYATTQSDCLDLFATIGALRSADEQEIISRFQGAFAEDPDLAMKTLFFARDVRGGLGERKVFRVAMKWLAENAPASVRKNLPYIAEYGRWDDLLALMGTACEKDALNLIRDQLDKDYMAMDGINNINRFLQENNPNPAITWGVQQYKVNDPILFNESMRFSPVIYNNMKGRIVAIEILDPEGADERIQFDIEVEKAINGIEAYGMDFELIGSAENGNSIIRFCVYSLENADADDIEDDTTIMPFQIAYAVSIHKAQGLEYRSVKLVVSDEIDELITHSIFYTAITRAREKLKIYWSPEVGHRVLSRIAPMNSGRDIALLKQIIKP